VVSKRRSASIFAETGDRHDEAIALENLGIALRTAGQAREAIESLRRAIAIFVETGDAGGEENALANLRLAQQPASRWARRR